MISKNMLDYICSSTIVCDMFLDFDNNKDYFNEGSYEDYYQSVKSYLLESYEKDIISSSYKSQKNKVDCVEKLYSLFCKDKDFDIYKDKIFNYLRRYKDMINILVIEKRKPFGLEDIKLRANALETAEEDIKKIDSFFHKYDYENVILNRLKEFDQYVETASINKKKFKEYDELISNIAIEIPQKYIDFYFKCLIKDGYQTSYDSAYNISRSMVFNLANENDVTCLFDTDDLKFAYGAYHDGIITISNYHLKHFCDNPKKNALTYLSTLFHEFTHLVQHANFKQDRVLYYDQIKMLEDRLIVETLDAKYDRNNYKNLSYELDARSLSKIMVYRYYKMLGIKFKTDKLTKSLRTDSLEHKSDARFIVDYKMIPVDLLFDEIIGDIISTHKGDYLEDIFEMYPILNLMYSKEGKRYSILELLKMREDIKGRIISSKELDTDLNKIVNINEIIYNRDLSFVNLVADYKELMLDDTLDIGEEKTKIKRLLYKRIKSKNSKDEFKDLSTFISSLLTKNNKSLNEEIESLVKTGEEMADYFYGIKDEISSDKPKLKKVSKKKAK